MDIREVQAIDTLALVQRVLRPHQTIDELALERDDGTGAVYFAAIEDGEVIGTASVHQEAPRWNADHPRAWQLRSMAIDEARRGQRVGTSVLHGVIEYVRERGGNLLWCKARVSAIGFYEGAGFTTEGERWEEPSIGPHIAMQRAIDPTT